MLDRVRDVAVRSRFGAIPWSRLARLHRRLDAAARIVAQPSPAIDACRREIEVCLLRRIGEMPTEDAGSDVDELVALVERLAVLYAVSVEEGSTEVALLIAALDAQPTVLRSRVPDTVEAIAQVARRGALANVALRAGQKNDPNRRETNPGRL